MERHKVCLYCQKKFTAKRIDAKFCSPSCRQMHNQRQLYPQIYGKVVPIYFDLEDDDYSRLLETAKEADLHPNEYVKRLFTRKEGKFVHLFFDQAELDGWVQRNMDKQNISDIESFIRLTLLDHVNICNRKKQDDTD